MTIMRVADLPALPRRFLAALALIPLLAACASTGGGKPAGARPHVSKPIRSPVRQPVKHPPPAAQVHMAPGLEGVIGATADDLTRRFGTPRLDVWEGDARKLQFSDTPCILDIYLYPPAQGREPQATYVEARRASDGRDVDKASCVTALRQR
jgi:hypothetical protein